MTFLAELFNIKKTTLIRDYYDDTPEIDSELDDTDFSENRKSSKSLRLGSLFQIIYYNLHNWNMKTPFHIMNAVEIYEKCKSREVDYA